MQANQCRTLDPKEAIGYFGGGQLGMMLSKAGKKIGRRTVGYAPQGDNPAARVADQFFAAPYTDAGKVREFASSVGTITFEFENIPLNVVDVAQEFTQVLPSANVLHIAQDRLREKQFFKRIGVPAVNTIAAEEELATIDPMKVVNARTRFLFPGLLKTRRDGYDGKGQAMVPRIDRLTAAWEEIGKKAWVLEEFQENLDYEISVIVARDRFGESVTYPIVRNRHREGILRVSECAPENVPRAVEYQAVLMATKIANDLSLIGILAVEMFVLKDGQVLVNELAPRPHNSGHGTIEGCEVSQFEQLLRIAAGEPVRDPKPRYAWRMVNIIGTVVKELQPAPRGVRIHLHDYGKAEARPGRKMGHVTQILRDWD